MILIFTFLISTFAVSGRQKPLEHRATGAFGGFVASEMGCIF